MRSACRAPWRLTARKGTPRSSCRAALCLVAGRAGQRTSLGFVNVRVRDLGMHLIFRFADLDQITLRELSPHRLPDVAQQESGRRNAEKDTDAIVKPAL